MGAGAANVLSIGRGGDGCGGAVGGGIGGRIGGDDGSGEGIDGGVGDDGSGEGGGGGGGGLGPEEKISTSQTSMDPADPAVLIRSNSACSALHVLAQFKRLGRQSSSQLEQGESM